MSAPTFEVLHCTSEADIERCFAIRVTVFCDEQGYALAEERDDKDPKCDHLLLLVDGVDAGTIRFYPPLSKLGRLAVLKPFRGTGAGKKLVDALHEHIAHRRGQPAVEVAGEPGTVRIVANSQEYAVPFYERCGYAAEGDIFQEDGQPHKKVTKRINLIDA